MSPFMTQDQWLSDVLKRDVYKLSLDDKLVSITPESSKRVLAATLERRGIFAYSKVAPSKIGHVSFLENHGFHLIDTNVVFEKPISPPQPLSGNSTVRFALPEDEEAVVRVAATSFQYSRFHLDKHFPIEVAHHVKGEWARNFFKRQRGDAMVVALSQSQVSGFLQLLFPSKDTLVIDLIAVDTAHQRQRIASDLIAFAETHCEGFRSVLVGTQLANVPSLRFYENYGFRISGASHVFHYHH